MTAGTQTVREAPVEGASTSYRQLLDTLGALLKERPGDLGDIVRNLKLPEPPSRMTSDGMTPETYGQRLGLPKLDSFTCRLTIVTEGTSLRVMSLKIPREHVVEVARALGKLRRANPGFDYRFSDGDQVD